ncbi:hypothetical protein N7488_004537 [Penicillium malachiteum]|nr:hypothetical protein N7488_004537 [Penicillium malachiteum]
MDDRDSARHYARRYARRYTRRYAKNCVTVRPDSYLPNEHHHQVDYIPYHYYPCYYYHYYNYAFNYFLISSKNNGLIDDDAHRYAHQYAHKNAHYYANVAALSWKIVPGLLVLLLVILSIISFRS